jgi:hypothetical protein
MIDYIQFLGNNGLNVFLNDDTYPMQTFDSSVDTLTEEDARPNVHGLFPTYTYMQKRVIHMEGDIFGADFNDFIIKRQQLIGPFIPQPELGFKSSGQLIVKYSGLNEAVVAECYLDGLPQVPLEALSPSRGTYAITLQCFDPILYGANQLVVKTGLPGASGGFVFPITFPLNFTLGQGGGGVVNVTNSGNASVYPVATIYGPCVSPSLVLKLTSGAQLTITLTGLQLNTGDYVVLDFKNRTVTTNTQGSAYSFLQAGSVWWQIPPGTSQVTFLAFDASGAAHAEIAYSNGYML